MMARGDFRAAITMLRNGLETDPSPQVRSKLVAALIDMGDNVEGHAEALRGVQIAPASWVAFDALARSFVSLGNYQPAADAFLTCARLRHRSPVGSHQVTVPVHFLLHAIEQLKYLNELPTPPSKPFESVAIAHLTALKKQLTDIDSENLGQPSFVSVSGMDADRLLRPSISAPTLIADDRPLQNRISWSEIDNRIAGDQQAHVVIDDFLTPAALQALQIYCLEATIWRRPYKFGYIGAFPEDGFVGSILFDIATALFRALPKTLFNMRLAQWWAFVYDPNLPGTDIHADDSDISLNLWITPNTANRSPERGGARNLGPFGSRSVVLR